MMETLLTKLEGKEKPILLLHHIHREQKKIYLRSMIHGIIELLKTDN